MKGSTMAAVTPTTEEDGNIVCYNIYLSPIMIASQTSSGEDHRHMLKRRLTELLSEIYKLVDSMASDYIWYNEKFNLKLSDDYDIYSMCLKGSVQFDDAMDDEWFVVYLLFQISNRLPDVLISVQDNDGEFLLIECADVLPKWLNADTARHRVFLYRGKLHLVSRNIKADVNLTLKEGLAAVVNKTLLTDASDPIQHRLLKRLSKYPGCIAKDHYHHAKCIIPARMAYILYHKPACISDFVNAFLQCEPDDLKILAKSPTVANKSSKGKNTKDDNRMAEVCTTVKFTKLQFAQILSQNLPMLDFVTSALNVLTPTSSEHLLKEIGLKLFMGFELVSQKWGKRFDALDNDSLKDIPSIKSPIEMLKSKKSVFIEDFIKVSREPLPSNTNEFIQNDPEDPSSWLDVNVEELEAMFGEACGTHDDDHQSRAIKSAVESHKRSKVNPEDPPMPRVERLNKLAQSFGTFLAKESSYEGVELSDDEESQEDSTFDSDHSYEDPETDIEEEILDTIRHDPDLLMKIIEKSHEHGMDYIQLLTKLKDTTSLGREQRSGKTGKRDNLYDTNNMDNSTESDDDDNEDRQLEQYFYSMDQELKNEFKIKGILGSNIEAVSSEDSSDEHADPMMMKTVLPGPEASKQDMDVHLVRQMVRAFDAQPGLSGPSSTVLASMKLILPKDEMKQP